MAAANASPIPKNWDVPQVFRDRMGAEVGRQRAMVEEGHLLLVLHAPPQPDEDHRQGRLFWRAPNGAWSPMGITHGSLAVDALLDEFDRAIAEIDEAENLAQSALQFLDLLQRLTPLVRTTQNLHQAVQDARQRLPDARELILLRDRAYATERRATLLLENARNMLHYVTARRAEEQARDAQVQTKAAHRLNVLAALFFPTATLAAVFGMELDNGLRQWDATHGPAPMVAILLVGLALGGLLALFITRK